jgi:hypothetical protein
MATAVQISQMDFENFVSPLGFNQIIVDRTREFVYAKQVEHNGKTLQLRIFSSIDGGISRSKGSDAIRVCLFFLAKNNQYKIVGSDRRVHRVGGWKNNLSDRLNNWREQMGPNCPLCGSPTVLREPKKGQHWKSFHGCVEWPSCNGVWKEGSIQSVQVAVDPSIPF